MFSLHALNKRFELCQVCSAPRVEVRAGNDKLLPVHRTTKRKNFVKSSARALGANPPLRVGHVHSPRSGPCDLAEAKPTRNWPCDCDQWSAVNQEVPHPQFVARSYRTLDRLASSCPFEFGPFSLLPTFLQCSPHCILYMFSQSSLTGRICASSCTTSCSRCPVPIRHTCA